MTSGRTTFRSLAVAATLGLFVHVTAAAPRFSSGRGGVESPSFVRPEFDRMFASRNPGGIEAPQFDRLQSERRFLVQPNFKYSPRADTNPTRLTVEELYRAPVLPRTEYFGNAQHESFDRVFSPRARTATPSGFHKGGSGKLYGGADIYNYR